MDNPYMGFIVFVGGRGYCNRTDFDDHARAVEYARRCANDDRTVWVELSGVHKDMGLVRLMFYAIYKE